MPRELPGPRRLLYFVRIMDPQLLAIRSYVYITQNNDGVIVAAAVVAVGVAAVAAAAFIAVAAAAFIAVAVAVVVYIVLRET